MVNKVLRAQTQLQDPPCWGKPVPFIQVANDPREAKLFFKHHGEGKTDFLTQMCLKGPREGNATSSNTRHPSQGGVPWRCSQHSPRSTFPTRKIHSWFRGPPNEAHVFVWNTTHSPASFWEAGTHVTYIRGHPSHSSLFEATS